MTNWRDPRVPQSQPGKLPMPPHWNDLYSPRGRAYFYVLGLMGAIGALSFLFGPGKSGLMQTFGLVWLAGMVAIGFRIQRSRPITATANAQGSTLYPDSARQKLMYAGFGVLSVAGIVYALLFLAGVEVPPLVSSPRQRNPTTSFANADATFAGVIGLTLGAILIHGWWRSRNCYLNLNPIGFHANEKPVKAARWEDVVDILDFVPSSGPSLRQKPLRPIVFVLRDGSAQVLLDGAWYSNKRYAVFWMVRNYWLHPEERGELLNGVALERLAREDFPCA